MKVLMLAMGLIVGAHVGKLHAQQNTLLSWQPVGGCYQQYSAIAGSGTLSCRETGLCSGGPRIYVDAYASVYANNCEYGFQLTASAVATPRGGRVDASSSFSGLYYGFYWEWIDCDGNFDNGEPFAGNFC